MVEQSEASTGQAAQLWLAVPDGAGAAMPRKSRRELERVASHALLTAAGTTLPPWRSLSHSGGCAAIAIAPAGCRIGVDIESTQPRDLLGIAQFAFAPAEARQLRALAGPEATARFYLLWTLKEAFAKALGMPLLAALRECVFVNRGGRWGAHIPLEAPWRAIVFAPRPALTLAAVIIGEPVTASRHWRCLEWPGSAAKSWPRLARLAGDDQRRQS